MTLSNSDLDLEVSKPQRNTRAASDTVRPVTRRSRSPDHQKPISPRGRQGSFRGSHYSPNSPGDDRDTRDNRGRDDYRNSNHRASSPRYGNRDGRDSRDDHYRRDYHERSRSPVSRYRSPTPPRASNRGDDGLPLVVRAPHQVPEVQMIILANLDRYVYCLLCRT